ncbi:hypothetical protein [Aquicella lusitana]|uniref:DUF2147 domain-containing protein n=1 Tax=Aquicella lusitana TaxID=254246 RepID=A0A370GYG1_9COXI|nr:hypothetical protein [Aquicella lusitana]RDI48688.1 hypothetical protein C8D86_102117 [Aquicella lusitana]VVC73935.1 hypothetical protein AQULUS_16960 [Aquicella lusitana]
MKRIVAGILFLVLLPATAFCDYRSVTWKGTYYQTIPNKKNVTQGYCNEHLPGTFIHTVSRALAHPMKTDRGIKLSNASFHLRKQQGIYFIDGDFWASKATVGKKWQDHIYYRLYKLTEYGETRGVWFSRECKGLYVGKVLDTRLASKQA